MPTLQSVAASLAQKYGIPIDLFSALIWSESAWRPDAYNPKTGALGIAQFLAETAERYGVNRLDPISSLEGAAKYLRDIWQYQAGGDWIKSVAIYKGFADPDGAKDIVSKILQQYGYHSIIGGVVKTGLDISQTVDQAKKITNFVNWITNIGLVSVLGLVFLVIGIWRLL